MSSLAADRASAAELMSGASSNAAGCVAPLCVLGVLVGGSGITSAYTFDLECMLFAFRSDPEFMAGLRLRQGKHRRCMV